MSDIRLNKYIPELDGLRALAILLVLGYHTAGQFPRVAKFFFFGWFGVDLFFVLSGFLITGILLDAKRESSGSYFKNFYIRRSLRIWPLYYLILFVSVLIIPRIFPFTAFDRSVYPLKIYLLYGQNVLFPFWGPEHLTSMWSLAVEEQFYLVWPFVVFLVSPKTLKRIVIALIFFAPIFRYAALLRNENIFFVHTFTLCRVDTLAFGALFALLVRSEGVNAAKLKRLSWSLIAISLLSYAAVHFLLAGLQKANINRALLYSDVALMFGGGLGLALIAAARNSALAVLLRNRVLRYISKISYGLYIYHLVIFVVVVRLLPGRPFTTLFVEYSLLFGIATASFKFFESPILSLKKRFENPRPAEAPPTNTKLEVSVPRTGATEELAPSLPD